MCAQERHVNQMDGDKACESFTIIDSAHYGNHARFTNDIRGTGETANVAFESIRDDTGDTRIWYHDQPPLLPPPPSLSLSRPLPSPLPFRCCPPRHER